MIELYGNQLTAYAPDVHGDACCSIDFQRTLRIPDDNRRYPLPAGLGQFPVFHVDDFADKVPSSWIEHGGVFLAMYQSEALWINFTGVSQYPYAIKIAAGKINAVSGETWEDGLSDSPQDYVVVPEQPWVDGFAISKGVIRQFVAMPLGQGFTAEGQITGDEVHGGLQLAMYPMKASVYAELQRQRRLEQGDRDLPECLSLDAAADCEMGLAPGGLMTQEIYDDNYGIDAWDSSAMSRCFVHVVNSRSFRDITGSRPPEEPPTAEEYEKAGIPWFDYWSDEVKALEGSERLAKLDSIAAKKIKQAQPVNEPVIDIPNAKTVKLGDRRPTVRDGNF